MELHQWLRRIGCRPRRHKRWILDGFDPQFFLEFDLEEGGEIGTADVLIVDLQEKAEPIRIMSDAKRHGIMRLLFAMGVDRFSEQTRKVLYEMSNPLKGE